MRFCSNCGEAVQDNTLYCKKCGICHNEGSKNIKVIEEPTKFCLNCGSQIESRYCPNCGTFALKIKPVAYTNVSAIRFLNYTKLKVQKEVVRVKSDDIKPLGILGVISNMTSNASAQYKVWVKNAGVFAVFMLAFSLGFAVLANALLVPHMEDMFYLSNDSYTMIDSIKKISNPIVFFFSMLYGTKTKYSLSVVDSIKGTMDVMMPYCFIILTIVFIVVSDKIRQQITKVEKNIYITVTMALCNGVLSTVAILLFQKNVTFSLNDSNMLELVSEFNILNIYDIIQSVAYNYGIGDSIILKSSISGIGIFINSFVITFGVLMLSTVIKFVAGSYKEMKALIQSMCVVIIVSAFVPAAIITSRIMGYEPYNWLTAIFLCIVLFGIFLTMMLTGRFTAVKYMMDSQTVGEVKLGLMKIMINSNGEKGSTSNPFELIFVVFMIFAILIILYYAVQLWKNREIGILDMLKESVMFSCIISIITAIFSKTASFSVNGSIKFINTYMPRYVEGIDISGNKTLSLNMGASNYINTVLQMFLVIFVILVISYFICHYAKRMSNIIGGIPLKTATLSFCIIILLLSFATIYTFNPHTKDFSGLHSINEIFTYSIEDIFK